MQIASTGNNLHVKSTPDSYKKNKKKYFKKSSAELFTKSAKYWEVSVGVLYKSIWITSSLIASACQGMHDTQTAYTVFFFAVLMAIISSQLFQDDCK